MHRPIVTTIAAITLLLAIAAQPGLAAGVDAITIDALLQRLEQQQRELDRQRKEIEALKAAVAAEIAVPAPDPDTAVQIVADDDDEHGLEFEGYGVSNYYARDWQTDEFAKDSIDTERFILELEYEFDAHWFASAELEFEHGGTGATLELDTQEEFGEFEQEIENGGEVLVEELVIGYEYDDWLNAKLGRFYVPVGRTNRFHKPQDYFTVARSDADASIIPQLWHESGVSVYGTLPFFDLGNLRYELQAVSGLDSSGFSSRDWVASGHQTRFEQTRAEDLAFVARLDYYPRGDLQIGGSYYGGNTAANRPKNDLDADAFVDILQFDGAWTPGNFTLRGNYIWGRLQNSHLVTEANRNLSNNLGVKRTPVASKARAWYLEAGYDLLPSDDTSLIVFGRYDRYDSMYETEGLVFDNPRWDREAWTLGINYLPLSRLVFKAEYSERTLDIAENNEENTFALGFGFTY
jgi:hypothetical protein